MGATSSGTKTIKGKLILLIMIISSLALVLSLALLVTNDIFTARRAMVDELTSLARLMGVNANTALDFDDEDFGNQIVGALTARPHILSAALYTSEGDLLVEYRRKDQPGLKLPDKSSKAGHEFREGTLHIFHEVFDKEDNDRFMGTLYLQSDMDRLRDRLKQYVMIALGILLVSTVVVYLLASRLQRVISDPILKLAHTARQVSETRDYTVRVRREADDETGYLVDRFNEMLAQIEVHERQLRDVNEQLAASERRALEATRAKSEFLANMSHELRTPLTAIIGFSEMLLDEARDEGDDQRVDDLDRVYGPANHLLGLINEILDLAKIEANKMAINLEDFSIRGVVDDVIATLKPVAEARENQLRVECPEDIGQLHADQMKVRQCLFNILGNANKFTEAGHIALKIKPIRKGRHEYIQFRITDTGIGMTEEQLGRLFCAFSQADSSTSRKYGGTGLGLVITKHFCEMMGGSISVSSTPQQGSSFTIRLPRHKENRPVRRDPHEEQSEDQLEESSTIILNPARGSKSILVIDDDVNVHRLIEKTLHAEGFNFHFVTRGEEGLRIAREEKPAVITLDVMMPGMDGWAILGKLKEHPETRDIPVIMLTIVANQELGFALGATDYLTKPVAREALRECVVRYASSNPDGPIMIVEDDLKLSEMTRRLLAAENLSSVQADNGVHALEKLRSVKPSMILLDLLMPVMDGFEFLAELQKNKEWSEIPVVVLTGKDLTKQDYEKLAGCTQKIFAKGADVQETLLAEVRRRLPSPGAEEDTKS